MSDASTDSDWANLLARYHIAFSFLSKVFFQSPALEFVSQLAQGDYFAEWPLNQGGEDTRTGIDLMRRYLQRWQNQQLADLEADFNWLFVGPGSPLAPPWESYYLSRDRLLFQEPTLAVRETYRRFGLDSPQVHSEPDDSLGLELGFLAELCSRGSAPELIQGQREFLRDHLLRWAPECLGLVIAHAREDYYRGAAHLALGCLAAAAKDFGVKH